MSQDRLLVWKTTGSSEWAPKLDEAGSQGINRPGQTMLARIMETGICCPLPAL